MLGKLNAVAALGLFSNPSSWTGNGDAVHNSEAPHFKVKLQFHRVRALSFANSVVTPFARKVIKMLLYSQIK